jgi:Htaa
MRTPLARRATTTLTLTAALALPAAATAAPPTIPLTSGTADWGVKQSFRNYIVGPIAKGEITTADGATRNADGTFRFPFLAGTYDAGTHALDASFDGTVRFTGHDSGAGPVLDLTISDPEIETAGNAGVLIADMRSRQMASGQYEDYPDAEVATLDLSGATRTPGAETMTITGIAATLTEEGAQAFGGFYSAGTELDPVNLTVGWGADQPDPDPQPDPPANPHPSPNPDPKPNPDPGTGENAPVASISALGRRRMVGGRRVALARLDCLAGTCTPGARKRVGFRIAGKRHSAAVLLPKPLDAGERGTVRLRLRRATRAALAGRSARVKLRVTLRSGDEVVRRTLRATLARRAR